MKPAHGERPLRALAYLSAAQICFVLLDATGKQLATEIGIPLVSLVRHTGHALLMLVFFAPTLGAALWRTERPGLQLLRGLSLAGFTLFFFTALGRLPQADATAINFIAPFAVMRWVTADWTIAIIDTVIVVGLVTLLAGAAGRTVRAGVPTGLVGREPCKVIRIFACRQTSFVGQLRPAPAVAQRNRHRALGSGLADDVAVELLHDFARSHGG